MRAILVAGLLAAVVGGMLAVQPSRDPSPDLPLTIVIRAPRNLGDAGESELLVHRLTENHVDRVWIQLKQDESDEHVGGTVFYPSTIAPVAPGFEDDRIGRFIAGATEAGIEVAGWLPLLHDPIAWRDHPDWRASWIDWDGRAVEQPGWLCPRSPEAIEYETDLVAEAAERYPQLTAIYIDFIRYDSDYSCVCDRCLTELGHRADWPDGIVRPITPHDVAEAGQRKDELWQTWIEMRAESICAVVDSVRDGMEQVRPDMALGACVLPFSASDYSFNTQAGQDLYEMARAGLDEVVLMGYWDDWFKTPQWLNDSIHAAEQLVGAEARLSVLLDGDMSVRRTRLTLDAITPINAAVGYFHYWHWSDDDFQRLRTALSSHRQDGAVPPASETVVSIRVDTEPDSRGRYDTISPQMVRTLMDLFESEGIRGTFITCARLAELQPQVIREVVDRGHEVGVHAYDHEQLDSMPVAQQLAVIDRSLDVFDTLGVPVVGFGAPRNSITMESRDRLIERGLLYDGSASYEPGVNFEDVRFESHSSLPARRILVIPFIEPNDWDARRVAELDAEQMLEQWRKRLDLVIESGEPCFVLDVHQWLATEPDNLNALRAFIQHARRQRGVRIETMEDAATFAAQYLEQFEHAVR